MSKSGFKSFTRQPQRHENVGGLLSPSVVCRGSVVFPEAAKEEQMKIFTCINDVCHEVDIRIDPARDGVAGLQSASTTTTNFVRESNPAPQMALITFCACLGKRLSMLTMQQL